MGQDPYMGHRASLRLMILFFSQRLFSEAVFCSFKWKRTLKATFWCKKVWNFCKTQKILKGSLFFIKNQSVNKLLFRNQKSIFCDAWAFILRAFNRWTKLVVVCSDAKISWEPMAIKPNTLLTWDQAKLMFLKNFAFFSVPCKEQKHAIVCDES